MKRLVRLRLPASCGVLIATLAVVLALPGGAQAETSIEEFSASPSTAQAGGHPDFTFSVRYSTRRDSQEPCMCNDARMIDIHTPTGFIGNPHSIPRCTLAEFNLFSCPVESQVGVTEVDGTGSGLFAPIYNMETRPDQAGLLAFVVPVASIPIFTELSGRTESDYGLDATSGPIPHIVTIHAIAATLWGVPAASSHDFFRFITPLGTFGGCATFGSLYGVVPCGTGTVSGIDSNVAPAPYLQNPTTCGVPLSAGADLTFYNGDSHHADYPWPATSGCDQLSFNPSLSATPTTRQADTASGIDIDLKVPQTQSPSTPSPSEIRSTTVRMPTQVSINANAANGKLSCSDAETAIGTRGPATCPDFSKVGTLTLDSSALPGPIPGAIYLGDPKPAERYRLILAADGFGTHFKIAGSIHPDPQTGRLDVSFKDLPQSPLTEFNMHFFGSERGLLATPIRCGTYPVQSEFVPWDAALPTQTSTSFFAIDSGPNGTPCPVSSRPFHPRFRAGAANNTAGMHTPFTLALDREDGEQNLTGLTVKTPPGFSASLRGIPYCPEAAIARLSVLGYSGLAEQASPACSPASQIGTAVAGAGAGTHPLYVNGKVYLAGAYKGAPLSLVVVIPAVSGPYDLGSVAVRAALDVDRETAQVTTTVDPLPQILAGIPLRTRSITVNLDRAGFALNPTNCGPLRVNARVLGDEGGVADVGSHFQVSNCADLPFEPKLTLKMSGGMAHTEHPALSAVLRANSGDANIGSAAVTLPHSEFLDTAHINAPCTRVQFAAAACPATSQVGTATVASPLLDDPLRGLVYLRSSNHRLPDLVLDLKGQIDIQVVGRVDTVRERLRTTFQSIPDVPVSRFSLQLLGGKKGLLVNSQDLCGTPHRAIVRLRGQNGASAKQNAAIKTSCKNQRRPRRGDRGRRWRLELASEVR